MKKNQTITKLRLRKESMLSLTSKDAVAVIGGSKTEKSRYKTACNCVYE